MKSRLATEIAILVRCEQRHGLFAAPAIMRLLADEDRPPPDVFPVAPAWVAFQWPVSGVVDVEAEWRAVDRPGQDIRP